MQIWQRRSNFSWLLLEQISVWLTFFRTQDMSRAPEFRFGTLANHACSLSIWWARSRCRQGSLSRLTPLWGFCILLLPSSLCYPVSLGSLFDMLKCLWCLSIQALHPTFVVADRSARSSGLCSLHLLQTSLQASPSSTVVPGAP